MAYYGLEHSYSKFSGKKVKEQLSSFLPNLPSVVDESGSIVSKDISYAECAAYIFQSSSKQSS